jgi:hypothetical protein
VCGPDKSHGHEGHIIATRFSDTPLDCYFVFFSPQQTLVELTAKLARRGGGKVESVSCFPSAASFPRPYHAAVACSGW